MARPLLDQLGAQVGQINSMLVEFHFLKQMDRTSLEPGQPVRQTETLTNMLFPNPSKDHCTHMDLDIINTQKSTTGVVLTHPIH